MHSDDPVSVIEVDIEEEMSIGVKSMETNFFPSDNSRRLQDETSERNHNTEYANDMNDHLSFGKSFPSYSSYE